MGWKFTLSLLVTLCFGVGQLAGQDLNCGDFFYDSGGPDGDHANNELQTWIICPDNPGDLVTLNFVFVDVESCCDDLGVYDGTGILSPLNLDIESPESFTSGASDGCLTVTWDSDFSVVNAGWEAIISCAPPPPCPNPTSLTISDITSSGATFSWSQVGNVDTWDVEILPAGMAPTGVPTNADITDNPFIWNGADSGTAYDFYLRGQCEDDGEFTDWIGPLGFVTVPGCGDNFYDSGGPDGQYMNQELETYTFCPDTPGDLIQLDFTFVDVEACCDDLMIYSGIGTTFLLEGDLEAPASFTSLSADGCLTVTWDSDFSVIRDGWEAVVNCIPPPPCADPNFLVATNVSSTGALLAWSQVGLVSVWDIEIVPAGMPPLGVPTIAGVTDNPYSLSGLDSGTAYDFYVRGQCEGDDEFTNWVGPVSFTTVPGCGDNFYDPGGIDGNYENNVFETYIFCPDTPGDAVILDFSFVDVEGCCDPLSIYNGTGTTDPINLDLEGPGIFFSTAADGCLTVVFDSDGSVQRAGWEATITCSPCLPDPFILTENVSVPYFGATTAEILIDIPGLSNYLIEYDTAGFELGTGNSLMTSDSLLELTGLQENTDYEFYITNLCDDLTENVQLGPFSFSTIYSNDVGITGVIAPTDECGLGNSEPVRVLISNFGLNPQSLIPLNYSVNGVLAGVNQPIDGFFTGIVSRDSTEEFEFDLNYDFDQSGEYTIQVWTEMMGDSDFTNDTFTIVLTRFAPPLYEDFEEGIVPDYLTANFATNLYAPFAHNNESFVLAANLFGTFNEFILDLPVLGPIQETDTLFFDYRYVDWPGGTEATIDLSGTDILSVLVSTDCGETFGIAYIQPGTDHEPSVDFRTVEVPLAPFEGENIQIRISGTYGSNFADYWLDVDNINLPRCDGLNISADVQHPSAGMEDGQIIVTPSSGIAPFEFIWDTGDMTDTLTNLAPGVYTVSITDRFGCGGELTVVVDVANNTDNLSEIIGDVRLAPNPTRDLSTVQAMFSETVDAKIEVFNLLGQAIWQGPIVENVSSINETIDLSQVSAGIYLVRIQAAGQSKTIKLVKSE